MRHTKVPAPLRNGGFLRLIRAWAYLKPLLQVTAGREAKTAQTEGGLVERLLHLALRAPQGARPIHSRKCMRTDLGLEFWHKKKGSRTNRKPLIFFMVPGARLELARCCHRRILSPLRLPIPPSRHSRRPEAHKAFRDYR